MFVLVYMRAAVSPIFAIWCIPTIAFLSVAGNRRVVTMDSSPTVNHDHL